MKKTLLTTTALAVTGFAGAASAEVSVKVGGYFTQTFAISSVDVQTGAADAAADYDGADMLTNAEIHFSPSMTLDNGITIGAHVELEANSSQNATGSVPNAAAPGDMIDEAYMTISGDFGKVIVGSENSVGYKMSLGAPDVSHVYVNSGSLTAFVPYSGGGRGSDIFRGTLGSTFLENNRNNDANRLSYFSPSFGGFQAGISYARDGGEGNGVVNNNAIGTVTDYIDIAASYGGTIGGMDLGLSARYGTASASGGGTDPEVWGAGLNLGFGAVKFGASYAEQDATNNNRDGRSYDVGISYTSGPMSYSLTYFNGNNVDNETPAFNEELEQVMIAARYTVNSNFAVSGFIAAVDFNELNPASTDDLEATVLGVSASFSF